MKTKTNFATTSDVRNLINATMEAFPKGPVRDGIQTKMFNYWDNLNAGNNLPAGSDRKRFHAEALDNYKAAIRMAISLGSKRDSSYEFKVTELERRLTGIKVGKNEMSKVEDKFYGKRVVKGIFAKAKFDKSNYYALEGTVDGNATGSKTVETIEEAMYYGKAMLEHMKKQSPKAKVATVHIFKVVNYQRENTPVKVLNSRTGSKAKFAKEYILWALPKGKTDTMYSQPIAEQLYTDAQINEVKRKATAAGWHTFRIDEVMSFEDMTNLWKGKPVKRRSSRTGAKAKFSMSVSYDPATELLTVGNKHYKCSRSQSGYVLNVLRNVRNAKNPSNEQARAIDEFQREGIISITDKTFNSKAKFANEEIAKGLSKVLKANGFDAMASQVLSGSTDSETLRKYIRALKSKMSPMSGNDRGMVLLETLEKQLASRTGAKVFK